MQIALSKHKANYRNKNLQVFVFSQDFKLLQTCHSIFKINVEDGFMFSNFSFLQNKKTQILAINKNNTEKNFKAEKAIIDGKHLTIDILVKKENEKYIVFIEDLTDAYGLAPENAIFSDEELLSEMKKIKNLQRLKNDHFAKIAHDIKLPLTEIVGTTYLMQNHVSTDKAKAYLKALSNASKNLDNMLNDLVNFTKSQSLQLRIEQKPFAIEQVIWSVIKSFEFKTTQQNVPIFLKADDSIPQYLIGDSSRLSQIIYNLLDNALKFTKQGKIDITINEIKTGEENCRLLFEVQDTGIGIPAENIKSIFETYHQARKEDALSGFGIGLSIVKQLIELQNGKIEAKSELGKGTCFSFELPFEIAKNLNK